MKSYEEVAKNVFRRRDEYEAKRYHSAPAQGHMPVALPALALLVILAISIGVCFVVFGGDAGDIHHVYQPTEPTVTVEPEPTPTTEEPTTESTAAEEPAAVVLLRMLAESDPLEDIGDFYPGEYIEEYGGLLISDGDVNSHFSREAFEKFLACCDRGETSRLRVGNYSSENNADREIFDMIYVGDTYTVRWLDNGTEVIENYRYMMHYIGQQDSERGAYDYYERYVLTNDDILTWEELLVAVPEEEYRVVYVDLTTEPWRAEIPENLTQAVLEYQGQTYITVTDAERLGNIQELLASAELIGYEPKTHSIGCGLNLILTQEDGGKVTIELDPESELFRMNGECYDYHIPDEPSRILDLWEYLGIEAWPMEELRDINLQ